MRLQRRVDGTHSSSGSDSGRELPGDASRSTYAAYAAAVTDEDSSVLDVAEGELLRRCGWLGILGERSRRDACDLHHQPTDQNPSARSNILLVG